MGPSWRWASSCWREEKAHSGKLPVFRHNQLHLEIVLAGSLHFSLRGRRWPSLANVMCYVWKQQFCSLHTQNEFQRPALHGTDPAGLQGVWRSRVTPPHPYAPLPLSREQTQIGVQSSWGDCRVSSDKQSKYGVFIWLSSVSEERQKGSLSLLEQVSLKCLKLRYLCSLKTKS